MNLYEAADYVGSARSIPTPIVFAQFQHESANGSEPCGAYNYAGIKEWNDSGKTYHDFESMEDFADYMSRYLAKYNGLDGVQTPEEYVGTLKVII